MTTLKDALHNLDPESGTDPDYARGVLVGALAATMQFKACSFEEAVVTVTPHLPPRIDPLAIPSGWEKTLKVSSDTETQEWRRSATTRPAGG